MSVNMRCQLRQTPTRRRRLRPSLHVDWLEQRAVPATIIVNSNLDTVAVDGKVTIREALNSINAGADANADVTAAKSGTYGTSDSVAFAAGLTGPINLTSAAGGQLAISKPVAIAGPGSTKLTIAGAAAASTNNRVFYLTAFGQVTISGLTISGANATGPGGGIVNFTANTITLTDVTVTGNISTGSGAGIETIGTGAITLINCSVSNNKSSAAGSDGGGINNQNNGAITLQDCTISGNSCPDAGGGVNMYNSGALTITGSTISGNTAGRGGGVSEFGSAGAWIIRNSTLSGNSAMTTVGGGINQGSGALTVQNSTLAFNSATSTGGGINRGSGTTTVESCIVAQNTAVSSGDDLSGTINKAYYCLIGAADGATITTAKYNKSGTQASPLDPQLGPLANNGGVTLTHLPADTSPAIGVGSNPFGLTTDQRGTGFPRLVGLGVDIGAIELDSVIPAGVATSPNVTTSGGTSQTITVNYTDETGIDTSTLGAADLSITGPAGAMTVAFTGFSGSGTAVTATYTLVPPGGSWNSADDGSYTINMVSNQVFDTDAGMKHAVPAGAIGSFSVAIPGTIVVNATNDEATDTDGKTSLREAIIKANMAPPTVDTITFDASVFAGPQTITLDGAELPITDSVTIIGPTARVTINANAASRIFDLSVSGTGTVTLTNLTLTNGQAADGGAILCGDDNLSITNCTIQNSRASGSGGGLSSLSTAGQWTIVNSTISGNSAYRGGGMYFPLYGALTVDSSTISGNTASGAGANGGGIDVAGAATIRNATISGNSSSGAGGGITKGSGALTVQNSTIVNNTAGTTGGGIQRGNLGGAAITSSIIAGNSAGTTGPDINGTTTTTNFSLIGNTSGVTISGANNLLNVNPRLGPLADNGGPTLTHLPLAASPVRNAGSNPAALNADQRGSGFGRVLEGQTDIGAVESINHAPAAVGAAADVLIGGGTSQTISVNYFDLDSNIDTTTLGDANITIVGPNGSVSVTFQGFTGSGKNITATYSMVPPGGTWDAYDSGHYTITMNANQVFDTDAPMPLPADAGAIASFNVAIPGVYTVTLATDEDDGDLAPNDISFREALKLANRSSPSFDTITFDPAVFATQKTIALTLGEMAISDDVTIIGPGAGLATIDAGGLSRILAIDIPGKVGTVNLSGLTLQNGFSNSEVDEDNGGAIFSTAEKLDFDGLVLTKNTANFGSALWVSGAGSQVTITNSQITGNTIRVGEHAGTLGFSGDVDLVMQNCSISGNISEAGMPGIWINYYAKSFSLLLDNCILSGNTAQYYSGGALYLSGAVNAKGAVIRNCTIANNFVNHVNSPLSGGSGGAISLYQSTSGTLSIENTTISGNTAGANGFGYGGAILNYGSVNLVITNSTISGNVSAGVGGAFYLGAGSNSLTLQNSTVTGNSAATEGGAIYCYNTNNTVTAVSSIIAGNSSPTGPNIFSPGAVNASRVAIDTTAGITTFNNLGGNLIIPFAAMKLGPLANNGGPTLTHSPLPGSVLINAGSNALNLTTDQRGDAFARVTGGAADIGAVEAVLPPTVRAVTINAGAIQRSRVTSLTVTFDQIVTLPAQPETAFELNRQSDNQQPALVAVVDDTGATTEVTLTFTGTLGVEFGSLADGRYTLSIFASLVTNGNGSLDGNSNGIPGDNYQLIGTPANGLFRLFGDADGSGTVDAGDFLAFRLSFLQPSATFDFDNSGTVDASDFLQFRLRFLQMI